VVVIPSDSDVSEPQILVNALTSVANFKTIRVTGYHKKKGLQKLINSGSAHNFLDTNMAKKLGYLITLMYVVNVVVADGTKLQITSVSNNFSWTLQQTTFSLDMLLIPLGCYDLVLGIEWCRNLPFCGRAKTLEKCAESPPTFIERKTLEKPKETDHKEYSRFGSYLYA